MTDLLENQNIAERYYKDLHKDLKSVLNQNSLQALKVYVSKNFHKFKAASFGSVDVEVQADDGPSSSSGGTLLLKFLEQADELKECKNEIANLKK